MIIRILLSVCLLLIAPTPLFADDIFAVIPAQSSITGSVKYTVVGRYRAAFEKYSGTITYDPKQRQISAVTLEIDVTSVKSKFAALDQAVRSPVLLNAKKFPKIIFKSSSISKVTDGFKVKGMLTMHGVTREVEFPFSADELKVTDGKTQISARGRWLIPRKDYGVVWNKLLDRGGVVVGNDVTVEWKVVAEK